MVDMLHVTRISEKCMSIVMGGVGNSVEVRRDCIVSMEGVEMDEFEKCDFNEFVTAKGDEGVIELVVACGEGFMDIVEIDGIQESLWFKPEFIMAYSPFSRMKKKKSSSVAEWNRGAVEFSRFMMHSSIPSSREFVLVCTPTKMIIENLGQGQKVFLEQDHLVGATGNETKKNTGAKSLQIVGPCKAYISKYNRVKSTPDRRKAILIIAAMLIIQVIMKFNLLRD